jgi:hypothetical protein
MRTAIIGLGLLLITGCGRGPAAPPEESGVPFLLGFSIDDEGRLSTLTGANYRQDYERRLMAHLDRHLGAGWTARVAIVPDALHYEASPGDEGGWRWPRAEVSVHLMGDGQGAPPVLDGRTDGAREAIAGFITQAMRERMPADAPLAVRVLVQPAPVGGAVATPGAPPVAPDAPADRRWRYTIQPGDTLAIISQVHYGTTDHWRHLLAANPGLDLARLPVGTVILVPMDPPPSSTP